MAGSLVEYRTLKRAARGVRVQTEKQTHAYKGSAELTPCMRTFRGSHVLPARRNDGSVCMAQFNGGFAE